MPTQLKHLPTGTPAYKVRAGVELDPFAVGLARQYVLEVTYSGNDHGVPAFVHIKTRYGFFTFKFEEPIGFPRRGEHGETIDWRKEWLENNRIPYVKDLAIGDLLPSRDAPPDRDKFDDENEYLVKVELWKRDFQRVDRIYRAMSPLDEYIIHVYDFNSSMPYKYKFHTADPIIFPHKTDYTMQRMKAFESDVYKDVEYEGVTYAFLTHPHGRGRWPSEVPVYERKSEPGHYVSRPPGRKAPEWVGLEYTGEKGKRHPYDPKLWNSRRASRKVGNHPAHPDDEYED